MKLFSSSSLKLKWLTGAAVSGLAAAAVLTGCGGGGGGPAPAPTPTAPPDFGATPLPGITPTPSPVDKCDANTYTPNYVADLDLLLHWPRFPLRVFITRNGEYSADRQNIVQAGFDQWTQATDNRTPYQIVTDASQADVTVAFETFQSGQELGETIIFYRGDVIEKAEMRILFTGNQADDQLTAAHEWGHALGIIDHSSNPADLMNAFGNPQGCSCVTQSDLNTLLTEYCNDFSPRSLPRRREDLGPLRSITVH